MPFSADAIASALQHGTSFGSSTSIQAQSQRQLAPSLARAPRSAQHLRKGVLLLLVLTIGSLSWTGCKKKEVAKIAVPDLVNQDVDQARSTLTAAGLTTGTVSGATGTTSQGAYVVSSAPAAGQLVEPSSAVDLMVAMPIMVPTLTTNDVANAVSLLQGLGLKVGFVKKSTLNPFGSGKVEQQDPAPNSPVRAGALVTLTVTTGPDISSLLGLVAKQPAYQNLKPEYKSVLDAFLGNPNTPRSMEPVPEPPTK
jgi:serine/threonine-protein kinase